MLSSIASLDSASHVEASEDTHTALVNAVTSQDDDVVSWNRVQLMMCMSICDAIADGFSQRKADAAEC